MNSLKIINDSEIYLEDKDYEINIEAPVLAKIFHYSRDAIRKVQINLNCENAKVEYHYSTICDESENFTLLINHNCSNTESNVYNHGINLKNNSLIFDITSIVPKKSDNCVCNQENQIINLNEGYSKINPNLLIDNYNVSSSHSAYIGVFKEDLLFYLMNRGIPRKKAIKLLIEGLLINKGNKEETVVKNFLEYIEEK